MARDPHDRIPDVRDGLTRLERVILWKLHEAEKEFGKRSISSFMLYGRVVEHVDCSQDEFYSVLCRLTGRSFG